jgi:RNA polymerase sigma-70 factor, ECF subfamily
MKIDNKETFENIFRAYYTDMLNYAFSFTHDITIAEEIVQDIFLSLWENRFQREINPPVKNYLIRAVKNQSINYKTRKLEKSHLFSVVEEKDKIQDVFSIEQPKDVHKLIRKGIQALPPKCQTIFLLSRFTSLTYHEIAEFMDVSVKTVETQMSIALKRMKEFLVDNGIM